MVGYGKSAGAIIPAASTASYWHRGALLFSDDSGRA
jgi:hypothetical protein